MLSPPRSPRGDEIIKKQRKPPSLGRKPAGTPLSEADLEILAARGLEIVFEEVAVGDLSVDPPLIW